MYSDLTPQQLSKYTEHSLRQLGIGGDADGISMMDTALCTNARAPAARRTHHHDLEH